MNRREALASLLALPVVGELKRLEVHPGQTLVLECAHDITPEQADVIRQRFREHLPGVKVLVLGPGMSLRVVDVR